ncbi:molybdopterin molybdotransferase MoeA [Methanospirillum lacunae]|uniref:Molybdopterin molybdenumtransferase MoeA n=1 Tax=Methanospirillum lacunae TaxID=668570 RepID=A0A2V2MW73_9EURY|nr:gephyrin-like molybdotransferase Glp [Methanospirillum lacunae]PWR69656.1 molybdopterin molybdenumtransferase MoeA [Methanospirillum lacunae]
MTRFLSVISVGEAKKVIKGISPPPHEEIIPLSKAGRRVLFSDIKSDVEIPGFDRSTVDGYAVFASDTTGASESIPSMLTLSGRIAMGEDRSIDLNRGSCMYIPTGGVLPKGADAVVMIEYCEELGDQILIHRPVAVGENKISKGEDFGSDRPAVKAGTVISSRVLGVLAACGWKDVPVSTRPRIGIISTGNELVPVDKKPTGGEIRDVNTWLCSGFVSEEGCIPVVYGIISDDHNSLNKALDEALTSCDAVLISGGSSKGERDMCAEIIASKGEVLVHGIAISPGKPTIIGTAMGKPIIGLPGHPASAYIILLVLVRELLKGMTGIALSQKCVHVPLMIPIKSVQGREDYIRGIFDGRYILPLLGKSGLTNTLLQSDGVIRIPGPVEGYEAGEIVEVITW